jgi:peptidoglycan/xylan/chitin deacetylase (PgdA/CDA1 family)
MTWDMVRELRAAGMAIGGHGVSHPVLARLAPEEQAREILGSAKRIREELGEPMRWFAYPVGLKDSFNEATRTALMNAGVELAFSYYGGHNPAGEWDRYDMRRIGVASGMDRARFRTTAVLPTLVASPITDGLWRRLRATVAEVLAG